MDKNKLSLSKGEVDAICESFIHGIDKWNRMYGGIASRLEAYTEGILYLRINVAKESSANFDTSSAFARLWVRHSKKLEHAIGFVVRFYKVGSTGFVLDASDIEAFQRSKELPESVQQFNKATNEESTLLGIFSDIFENSAGVVYTRKLQDAVSFALKTHEVYQKQKRKGKDIPYITHPLTVGLILARAGANEDVVVAGILHDTLEDSVSERKVTKEMLAERFGENVAELVDSVTERRKDLPWKERKQEALKHIDTFSHDALLVKSGDVISNASELIEDYKKHGESIFVRFNAPKEEILENYLNVISAINNRWTEHPFISDLAEAEIQLGRILAIMWGHLSYAIWTISFIEYEMKRIFSNSRFSKEVLRLCEEFHLSAEAFSISENADEFLGRSTAITEQLANIIRLCEEGDFGVQFLLVTHVADVLDSLAKFKLERTANRGVVDKTLEHEGEQK